MKKREYLRDSIYLLICNLVLAIVLGCSIYLIIYFKQNVPDDYFVKCYWIKDVIQNDVGCIHHREFTIDGENPISTEIYQPRCVLDTPYRTNVTYWCSEKYNVLSVYPSQPQTMRNASLMGMFMIFTILSGVFCIFLSCLLVDFIIFKEPQQTTFKKPQQTNNDIEKPKEKRSKKNKKSNNMKQVVRIPSETIKTPTPTPPPYELPNWV